jgi:hypothetical protein
MVTMRLLFLQGAFLLNTPTELVGQQNAIFETQALIRDVSFPTVRPRQAISKKSG